LTESKKLAFAKAYELLCKRHKMFVQHDGEYPGYFVLSLNEGAKESFKAQLQELKGN